SGALTRLCVGPTVQCSRDGESRLVLRAEGDQARVLEAAADVARVRTDVAVGPPGLEEGRESSRMEGVEGGRVEVGDQVEARPAMTLGGIAVFPGSREVGQACRVEPAADGDPQEVGDLIVGAADAAALRPAEHVVAGSRRETLPMAGELGDQEDAVVPAELDVRSGGIL